MQPKLLTFLGLGKYEPVTYHWGEHECTTDLFPEALARWLQPAEILVLLTAEAKAHTHWQHFRQRLRERSLVEPQPIDIPSGKSERELWTIFTTLTGHVDERHPFVFDVTHAFRSLPIVALLATAYLRVAHTVQLQHLLYGAFEARVDGRAPVFDLTPFLGLLDWVTASDQFLRTGNAEALAKLLPPGSSTGPLAVCVTGIAQGLHLLRPMDVMREAAALPGHITAAVPDISTKVPPFASLIEHVKANYGAFGLPNPTDYATNAKASLLRQLRMTKWYADKGQFAHALSMAREWLPSLLCWNYGADPMDTAERADMELLLSGGVEKDRATGDVIRRSPRLPQWEAIDKSKRNRLTNLWGGELKLAHLRNDVLHSGFRKNPRTAQAIANDTRRVIEELKAIAVDWKLEE
jgi:CRISPR-associated DxTHG motif protein